MQDVLTAAIEMHRSGQLGPASQLYQKVLAHEQGNAEALHLLGVLYHQQGQHARAVELISRAVTLRPNSHIYHANLAEAYRALGDFDRAVGCCRTALSIWPNYPEALCNLGAALQGLGQHAESVEQLGRALELRPNFVVAHNNLGIGLRELGRKDEALDHFRAPSSWIGPLRRPDQPGPDPPGSRSRPKMRCRTVKRRSASIPMSPFCTTISATPCGRSSGLLMPRRLTWKHCVSIRSSPSPMRHLGLVIQREGQPSDGMVWLKKAVELEPEKADFWQWLAELYDEMEEPGDSIACWERVLALEPDRAGASLVGLGCPGGRSSGRSARPL